MASEKWGQGLNQESPSTQRALPSCAGPIWAVALGAGLGAPAGLLTEGLGLAAPGLTFAAPVLGLVLGLVVAALAFWLRFTVVCLGGATASIGSVLEVKMGEGEICDCTPRIPFVKCHLQ